MCLHKYTISVVSSEHSLWRYCVQHLLSQRQEKRQKKKKTGNAYVFHRNLCTCTTMFYLTLSEVAFALLKGKFHQQSVKFFCSLNSVTFSATVWSIIFCKQIFSCHTIYQSQHSHVIYSKYCVAEKLLSSFWNQKHLVWIPSPAAAVKEM